MMGLFFMNLVYCLLQMVFQLDSLQCDSLSSLGSFCEHCGLLEV